MRTARGSPSATARLRWPPTATSVEAFRDLGILPEALVNFLALLGWSYDGRRELFTLEELEQSFSLERVGSNPAVFNLEKLEWINGQHLKGLPEEERVRRVEEFLAGRGHDLGNRGPEWRRALVRAIGERLKTLAAAERYGAFALNDALEIDEASWSELRDRAEAGARLEAVARRLGALSEFTLEELGRVFRIDRVGSNPAVFNLEKLEWMNGQHLKRLPPEERARRVTEYLAARGIDLGRHGPAWVTAWVTAIGDRLKTLADAERYGGFALSDRLDMEEAAWAELRERPEVGPRLAALAARIEADPEFTFESLERLTRGLAAELGIKAGELIGMARVALTGRKVSPGIFEVLWLLGRERAVSRLRAAAARWQEESPHVRAPG